MPAGPPHLVELLLPAEGGDKVHSVGLRRLRQPLKPGLDVGVGLLERVQLVAWAGQRLELRQQLGQRGHLRLAPGELVVVRLEHVELGQHRGLGVDSLARLEALPLRGELCLEGAHPGGRGEVEAGGAGRGVGRGGGDGRLARRRRLGEARRGLLGGGLLGGGGGGRILRGGGGGGPRRWRRALALGGHGAGTAARLDRGEIERRRATRVGARTACARVLAAVSRRSPTSPSRGVKSARRCTARVAQQVGGRRMPRHRRRARNVRKEVVEDGLAALALVGEAHALTRGALTAALRRLGQLADGVSRALSGRTSVRGDGCRRRDGQARRVVTGRGRGGAGEGGRRAQRKVLEALVGAKVVCAAKGVVGHALVGRRGRRARRRRGRRQRGLVRVDSLERDLQPARLASEPGLELVRLALVQRDELADALEVGERLLDLLLVHSLGRHQLLPPPLERVDRVLG